MNSNFQYIKTNETSFWIYTIKDTFWNILDKNIKFLVSYKKDVINNGDIIFIHYVNTNRKNPIYKHGIIALCVAETYQNINVSKKIFDDKNLNKYILNVKDITIFNKTYSLNTLLENNQKFKSPAYFIKKYASDNVSLKVIDNNIGLLLLSIFNKILNTNDNSDNNSDNDDSDNDNSDNDNSDNDNSDNNNSDNDDNNDNDNNSVNTNNIKNNVVAPIKSYNSDITFDKSDNSDDEPMSTVGNIPILLIPCKELEQQLDNIEKIKTHYMDCEKCNRYNNNKREIYNDLIKRKISYKIITDINEINKIEKSYNEISKYLRLQYGIIEPDIIFTKISKTTHYYNNCIFILW